MLLAPFHGTPPFNSVTGGVYFFGVGSRRVQPLVSPLTGSRNLEMRLLFTYETGRQISGTPSATAK